jgi:hypothetical protein
MEMLALIVDVADILLTVIRLAVIVTELIA